MLEITNKIRLSKIVAPLLPKKLLKSVKMFSVRIILILVLLFLIACAGLYFSFFQIQGKQEIIEAPIFKTEVVQPSPSTEPIITLGEPPISKEILIRKHMAQTFNNCGPATLSMLLSYFDVDVSQQELGQKLRPYQIPGGDNDDKSVFLPELANEAQSRGFYSVVRPNGSFKLLKDFINHDIPVVVITWLHPNEDIGHYRIIRGYDDTTQQIIQDDSYEGKNLRYSYPQIDSMWQPFNYQYLIIVPQDKKMLAETIMAGNANEQKAWENSYQRAQTEIQDDASNPYPVFNLSVSSYYLGKYQESIQNYEKVASKLPKRMLWYQIEPIRAYQKLKDYQKVFSLTDQILNNHNRAFSELYIIRSEVYQDQGKDDLSKLESDKAILYNKNLAL